MQIMLLFKLLPIQFCTSQWSCFLQVFFFGGGSLGLWIQPSALFSSSQPFQCSYVFDLQQVHFFNIFIPFGLSPHPSWFQLFIYPGGMGNTSILRVRATQIYTLSITTSSLLLPHSHLLLFSIFSSPIPYRKPMSLVSDLSFLYCFFCTNGQRQHIFLYSLLIQGCICAFHFSLRDVLATTLYQIHRVLPHFF